MRIGRSILKLVMVYAGLLAGVFLAIWYAVYRQGGLVVPYRLLFIYFFGIVFAQFYVINIFFLLIGKLFSLNLDRGPVRYFIISFMYALLYSLVVVFIPNKIIINEVKMNVIMIYIIIPIIVFLATAAAEILIANLIGNIKPSPHKSSEPDMPYGLPFKPRQ